MFCTPPIAKPVGQALFGSLVPGTLIYQELDHKPPPIMACLKMRILDVFEAFLTQQKFALSVNICCKQSQLLRPPSARERGVLKPARKQPKFSSLVFTKKSPWCPLALLGDSSTKLFHFTSFMKQQSHCQAPRFYLLSLWAGGWRALKIFFRLQRIKIIYATAKVSS